MKSQMMEPSQALLLSLTLAMQQERAARSASEQADANQNARLNDLYSARNAVTKAEEEIRQFAASAQIEAVEVNPDREAFYGQALKSGVMTEITPPAIGEYWVGQGGIYGGIRLYDEGLCYVIFGAEDLGPCAWSNTNFDLVTSRVDGRVNTKALNSAEHSNPAAEAASNYTADGHQDFYLPAIGELHHGWLYTPDSFANALYWSSSQRSAYSAYYMDFGVGWLDLNGKHDERLARPVRRFLR